MKPNLNDVLTASLLNWNDWQWQMRQKPICSDPAQLAELGLINLTEKQRKRIGLTPYNVKLLLDLKKTDQEAYHAEILQSFLPLKGKNEEHQWSWARRHDIGLTKWFEKLPVPKFVKILFTGRGSDTKVQALENMYPCTDVIIATAACARHCSFCFREVGDWQGEASQFTGNMGTVLNAVNEVIKRKTPHVLVTGGDPLTRSNMQLQQILAPLIESVSVQVVRLATRMVVDLPMRFYDEELLAMLKKFADKMKSRNASFRIVTHVDHPCELTSEAIIAIRNIQNCGIEIMNQTAVFKGVNDNIPILQKLLMELDQLGVRNHKLFHSMPVAGTEHLRISIRKFRQLVAGLHQWIPGTSVPQANVVTLVGKMPLLPKGRWMLPIPFTNRWLVRSFRGEWFIFKDAVDFIRNLRELGVAVAITLLCLVTVPLLKQKESVRFVSNDHVVITKVISMTEEFDYPDAWMRSFTPFVENGVLYKP